MWNIKIGCEISTAGFLLEILMFRTVKLVNNYIGIWGLLRMLRIFSTFQGAVHK